MRMHGHAGGARDDIDVRLILRGKSDGHTPRRAATRGFHNFDAAKARCGFEDDRQRLMAAIEAAFGTAA